MHCFTSTAKLLNEHYRSLDHHWPLVSHSFDNADWVDRTAQAYVMEGSVEQDKSTGTADTSRTMDQYWTGAGAGAGAVSRVKTLSEADVVEELGRRNGSAVIGPIHVLYV